jgi:class 3 adenylate cyclase
VSGRSGAPRGGDAGSQRGAPIDALIDRAVEAINRGDRVTATALAGQVFAVDGGNADAEDLLAAPRDAGENRRLTILFADLVDSTKLSTRIEPETYRAVVGRYREQVRRIVARYEGHIGGTAGDGVLAVFGHAIAHEDDVRRAVRAGMEVVADMTRGARILIQTRAPALTTSPLPARSLSAKARGSSKSEQALMMSTCAGSPHANTFLTPSRMRRMTVSFPNLHEREQISNEPALQSDSRWSSYQAGSRLGSDGSHRNFCLTHQFSRMLGQLGIGRGKCLASQGHT